MFGALNLKPLGYTSHDFWGGILGWKVAILGYLGDFGVEGYIVPLKKIEYGVYGILIITYPKPYSMYLRGTISSRVFGRFTKMFARALPEQYLHPEHLVCHWWVSSTP